MFRGITAINIDEKGRMAVPSRYRETLASTPKNQLVVTVDTEVACLLLYPFNEWEIIEQKLQELPSFNPQARRIQRLLIGHATELDMDKSGRVLLPPVLRDYAKLDKHAMLVGQGKKFEIWDEASWNHGREAWLVTENNNQGLPPELEKLSL